MRRFVRLIGNSITPAPAPSPVFQSITPPVPASGLVSVASQEFTLTATDLASPMIATPHDALSGSFFPPTVTLPAGPFVTATFQLTPNVVGSHAISVTNNAGLANPTPTSYTATAAPPPPSLSLIAPIPSSGTNGVASGNFTASATNLVSTMLVTPSDTLTGTFTPTSFSMPAGTSTSTFALTPGAVGTHVVSLPNNAGLTSNTVNYVAAASPPPAPTAYRVGANPVPPGDLYIEPIFNNLRIQSRGYAKPSDPFLNTHIGPNRDIVAGKILDSAFCIVIVHDFPGTYHCRFTGGGAGIGVTFTGSGMTGSIVGKVTASGVTTFDTVITVAGSGTYGQLNFTGNDGTFDMRSLQFMVPGVALSETKLFTDAYATSCALFGCYRFMQWANTNFNHPDTANPSKPYAHFWEDRVTPNLFPTANYYYSSASDASYGVYNDGVPYEYMVELCNQTGRDMWLNIKAGVDIANYIPPLVTLVDSTLHADAVCYLEYSNELWNVAFTQGDWLRSQAVAYQTANPGSLRIPPETSDPDQFTAANRYAGLVTKNISDLVRATVGDAKIGAGKRFRIVMPGQSPGGHIGGCELVKVKFPANPVNYYFQAVAEAPYVFLTTLRNVGGATTAAAYSTEWKNAAAIAKTFSSYNYELVVSSALRYGTEPVCYEGNISSEGNNQTVARQQAFLLADTKTAVDSMFNDWGSAGGGLFMMYEHGLSKFNVVPGNAVAGNWNSTDSWSNLTIPRLASATQYQTSTVTLSTRNAIPGVIDGRATLGHYAPFSGAFPRASTAQLGFQYMQSGPPLIGVRYLFLATSTGDFNIKVKMTQTSNGQGATWRVDWSGGGATVSTLATPTTAFPTGTNNFLPNVPVSIVAGQQYALDVWGTADTSTHTTTEVRVE